MHRLELVSRKRTATPVAVAVCGLLMLALLNPLNAAAPRSTPKRAPHVPPQAAPAEKDQTTAEPEEVASIDVLKGLKTGQISATAEGNGDGRMILSLTNRTKTKLRVVLPPGLIASGATGQFGGMGGMMGGMGGGMGGMGGGMGMMGGGMGGGMGGMGGGMGGMGGGMGGMRGGMGGRGMMGGRMGGTMPASMGMMMLGRLIMSLIGDRDSWDQRSLMMGMMMMGGRGMMGGGMGGMMGGGMGMMGGMGGGFRSIPPTGLPEATLAPRQTRHLPTVIVSLNGPDAESKPMVASKGEPLKIGGIDDATDDTRTRTALKRLAAGKVPPSISQMVLWYIVAGADWEDIGRLSQGWGNAHEISLARQFVSHLDQAQDDSPGLHDPGRLYYEIEADGADARAVAESLRKFWAKCSVLGLTPVEKVPDRPKGSSLACRLRISATSTDVKLASSHPSGSDWVPVGELHLKRDDHDPAPAAQPAKGGETVAKTTEPAPELNAHDRAAIRIGDALAEGFVARLVRVRLTHGPRVKGQETFKIKIINDSPLILNGLALGNAEVSSDNPPSVLMGMNLPPLKSMTVPASGDVVKRLRLKEEGRILAADLSGL